MNILSTRRRPTPCPTRAPERHRLESGDKGHSPVGSITHAAVEATDALLHATHLTHSHTPELSHLGEGLRAGVGALALARGTQALLNGKGIHAKLEGMASLGLGVASTASLFHSGAAATVTTAAQSVRGLSEVALGGYQLYHYSHAGEHHEKSQLAKGLLNCAKGATTFIPMFAPHAGSAVGVLHLGIVGASLALELAHPE